MQSKNAMRDKGKKYEKLNVHDDMQNFSKQTLCCSDFVHYIYKYFIFTITPNGSDSVNFWFYVRSRSRPIDLVAIEMNFPGGLVLNSRASLAGTFVEIEHSTETDEGVEND